VERAGTSAAIDELQTRIQALDLELFALQQNALQQNDIDPDQAQRLWSERVQLLTSLVGVRYAEASRNADWANHTRGDI
jgi:hypothetical protein